MKKKLGVSLLLAVILISVIASFIGVLYALFSPMYAVDNESSDFSFAIVDGKQKEYTGNNSFVLGQEYKFDMQLPKGASNSDVVFEEEDSKKLLETDGNSVRAIKVGNNGKLKATLKYNGKTYEATTKYSVKKPEFSFPIVNNVQKEYTGDNAFEIEAGYSYTFKMSLPRGASQKDVMFSEDNTDLLDITEDGIIPKKTGNGVLIAKVIVDGKTFTASTPFEVVTKKGDKSSNNTSTTSKNKTVTNTTKKEEVTLKFKNEEKTVAFSKSGSAINTLTKTGVSSSEELQWSSSDEKVATIDNVNTGKVKLQGIGKTTITVVHSNTGIKASYNLVVYQKKLDVIDTEKKSKLANNKVAIFIGDTAEFDLQDINNSIAQSDIKWTSSNEKVCTVDENGKITAIAKGTAKIKGALSSNSNSTGAYTVNVASSKEEKMLSETFAFATDPDTGKEKQYVGKSSFVVGEEYTFDMIRPEGTENYPVEYSCNKDGLLDISGETIRGVRVGSGTLVATIKIGDKKKTAKTKFQIVATQEEKNSATLEMLPYIYVDFDTDYLNLQVDKVFKINSNLETNLKKDEYTINWSTTDEGIIQIEQSSNLKTASIKALKPGSADITVSVSANDSNSASTISSTTMTIDVKEKVVPVKSIAFDTKELTKSKNKYQLVTGELYTIPVVVSPEDATQSDYKIELLDNDEENFMITENNQIVALVSGKTAKLKVTSLDESAKTKQITIESTASKDEINSLQPIVEQSEINLIVGETQVYRTPNNLAVCSKNNSNISLDEEPEVVRITGKKVGKSKVTVRFDDNTYEVAVNVEDSEVVTIMPMSYNSPNKLSFDTDEKTGKIKDYVNDHPLEVGVHYTFGVNADSYDASNEVVFSVDNTDDFSIVDNHVVALNENARAKLTATSKYDSNVKATVAIASTDTKIKSISFLRDYVGGDAFNIANNSKYPIYLKIELVDGTVYNPLRANLTNNKDYKKLLDEIEIYTDDTDLIKIVSNKVSPIKGKNGKGVIKARVKADTDIASSASFETIGINETVEIIDATFAKSEYDISDMESLEFKPIITLSNNKVLDPSKDYGKIDSVANSDEYKHYLSQLELATVKGNNKNIASTSDLVSVDKKNLKIVPKKEGICKLGLKLKDGDDIIDKTTLVIGLDYINGNGNDDEDDEEKVEIKPIEHGTTTNDKSLKITKVEFADSSYILDITRDYVFRPFITLSDGTVLSQSSANQDVYKYYMSQLDLFVVGEKNTGAIDLGILYINNDVSPKLVIGQKAGTIKIGFGRKGEKTILGQTTVTIK